MNNLFSFKNRKIFSFLIVSLLMMTGGNMWAANPIFTESFETGLPASYNTGAIANMTLSSGVWQHQRVMPSTSTGVNSGARCCQMQNNAGAQIISPNITVGVSTVTFYVTSSTTSGALQVNYSTDGGTTWTPATESPFTGLGTTKVLKTATINSSAPNILIQFLRTGATIYLDDVTVYDYEDSDCNDPATLPLTLSARSSTTGALNGTGKDCWTIDVHNASGYWGLQSGDELISPAINFSAWENVKVKMDLGTFGNTTNAAATVFVYAVDDLSGTGKTLIGSAKGTESNENPFTVNVPSSITGTKYLLLECTNATSGIYARFYGAVISGDVPATAPPNDLCDNATALPCETTDLAGTTANTTAKTDIKIIDEASAYGVFYTFEGDGKSTTITSTANGGFDHSMVIYSGSCVSLTKIAKAESSGNNGTETHTFTSVAGTTYYVYIANWQSGASGTGAFTISRTCTESLIPANDLCDYATELPCGTTNLAGTTENTTQKGSPMSQFASPYGVFYTFVGNGLSTTISSKANGSFDHTMGIFSGSCGSLTRVTDPYYDEDNGGSGGTETYTFIPIAGTTYYVYIADYRTANNSSNTGTFTISRTCATPDIIAISNNTSLGTVSLSGTTITATPNSCVSYADPAYTVTAGTATVSQSGNTFTVTPVSNCTVRINFEAIPNKVVTLNDRGSISQLTQATCTSTVSLPSLPDACDGWTLVGWKENSPLAEDTQTDITSTLKNGSYLPAGDITMYAVYKNTSGGGSTSWDKVTALTNITAGTYVILNGDYYLPNAAVSSGGPAQITIASKSVSVSGNSLTGTIASDMIWNFSGTYTAMTIESSANSSNKMYVINDNQGIRIGSTSNTWTFETYSTGFAMSSKDTATPTPNNRYCAVYTAGSNWRSYTSRNQANYATNSGILDIYKLSGGGGTTTYSTTTGCVSCVTPPTLDDDVIDVDETTLMGAIDDDGGCAVTEYGFVYNTTGSPTTADEKVISDDLDDGFFTMDITSLNLACGETYYFRSYAINSAGTGYSANEFDTVFPPCPLYTVYFESEGTAYKSPKTQNSYGAAIDLPPAPTSVCEPYGWTFAGWKVGNANAADAPTITTSTWTPTGSVTLYAVYETMSEEGSAYATLNSTDFTGLAASQYADPEKSIVNSDGTWYWKGFRSGVPNNYLQLDNTSYIKVPVLSGNISKIVIDITNASNDGAYGFSVYFRNSIEGINLTDGQGATSITLEDFSTPVTTGYIQSSGSCRIRSVVVTYFSLSTIYNTNPNCEPECEVEAPAALAANPVGDGSFTANWEGDATDYELYVYTKETIFEETVFLETFEGQSGTGGNDGNFTDGSSGINVLYNDWTFTAGYGAYQCLRFGTGSALGSAETPALLDLNGDATLTFRAAAWNGTSEQTTIHLFITGGGTLSKSKVQIQKGIWSNHSVGITGGTSDTKIKFSGISAANSRFYLDDVKVFIEETENKIPVSGYNPKDVSDDSFELEELPTETYYYVVKAKEGDCVSDESTEIKVVITNSSSDIETPQIVRTIYTVGNTLIVNAQAGETIEIYNVLGQPLTRLTAQDGETRITVPSGVLLVRIAGVTAKVVVK